MTLLILGLILWTLAHYFKRLMPEKRAAMGDNGIGLVTAGIVAGLILMILGYRMAAFIPVWNPPSFMVHINNLLMLFAFWVFGSSAAKGGKVWPANKIRHPQLTAVKIWATAHLLTNGDLASIILFGGLLGWAVGSVILINKAEPDWTPPGDAIPKKRVTLAIVTVVLFTLVALVHMLLGVSPFPG